MAIVSIIIPVHNAAAYIERCAHSLFSQTLLDLEFIFVDDASSDDSMTRISRVLESYPQRESQVKIVSNPSNLGVTETRKVGLACASGEYVGWVDADDWVESRMFESLYQVSLGGGLDIVVCDYLKEYDAESVPFHHDLLTSPAACLEHLNSLQKMPHSLWSQIIKRTLFDEEIINNLRPSNWGEDLFFVISAYSRAQSIAQTSECLYHYNRTNATGLSHSTKFESKEAWLMQRENVELCSHLLQNAIGKKSEVGVCHLKFVTKNKYIACFETWKDYYYQWQESHRKILLFDDMPWKIRLKLRTLHSSYFLYSFYCRLIHA